MAEQHEKALVPQIRFTGFTDPWEQRKLSDLTDRVSIQSSDSDLPQVEYEDIIPGEGTLNKDLRDKKGGKTGIKFYAGDVLYGKLRPYLMNWLYPQFNGVAVGDFWVLRATECDSSFLYRLVQTGSFQRLANVSSGSKMPRADWNLISQSFFAVPADHAEQKAIAKGLAELDTLITLHQRKYDKLCVLKKSMLDKMFPKGGSLYPEIRFAGFTDPWEQRKLEDYVVVSTAKNVDGRFNKEDVLSVSGEYGIVNQIAFQGRSFAGSSVLNYGIVNTGDIVYTKSPLNSNPYGIIKVNKGIPGIVSTLYAVYRPQDNVHTNFIQVYFEQHERMNNYMHPLVNKGAKNDMKVTAENALKGVVTFPSREEQVIISEFFDRLDSLITLHQRKYDGCANPLFLERRISCRKPSHQNRCSATTTPSG